MPFETAQITGGKSPDIQISIYPAVAQITWTWEDEEGIVQDYEHFSIPFILTVDKVLGKIRNSTLYYGNGGSFIPGTIENALEHKGPQFHYRNECLCRGMVNFNMIDTVGRGIKKIYTEQRNRFFPMPDYDIDNEHRTVGVRSFLRQQLDEFCEAVRLARDESLVFRTISCGQPESNFHLVSAPRSIFWYEFLVLLEQYAL